MTQLIILSLFLTHPLLSAPSYCDKPIEEQTVGVPFCPQTPARNSSGNLCYSASPVNIDRHAPGYKEYLLPKISQAVEFANQFAEENIDLTLLMSVLSKESWFNPVIKNRWNDRGIAQFQLATAQSTVDYIRELGISLPDVNTRLPKGCKVGSYSDRLTKKCLSALKRDCDKEPFNSSLYCPGFALKLMAFHFLQISLRDVTIETDEGSFNARALLTDDENPAAHTRHLASVYNRGFRIYTSAFHAFHNTGEWPSAAEYGPLWATKRELDREADPFEGGTLDRHYINRCYVWAITGLCGGLKDSLIHDYTNRLCHKNNLTKPKTDFDSRLVRLLDRLEYEAGFSLTQLHDIVLSSQEITTRERSFVNWMKRTARKQEKEVLQLLKSTNPSIKKRRLQLKFVKAMSKKRWQSTRRPVWLYLSGLAGYYNFSSGQTELKGYLLQCENSDCAHKLDAQKRLKRLRQLTSGKGR